MTSTTIITGTKAIKFAELMGVTLSKYTDPTEEAREGLSVDEARTVAAQDPALVYVDQADAVTDEQLEELCRESDQAGDVGMAELCRSAIGGNRNHRAHCAMVIADALASDLGD